MKKSNGHQQPQQTSELQGRTDPPHKSNNNNTQLQGSEEKRRNAPNTATTSLSSECVAQQSKGITSRSHILETDDVKTDEVIRSQSPQIQHCPISKESAFTTRAAAVSTKATDSHSLALLERQGQDKSGVTSNDTAFARPARSVEPHTEVQQVEAALVPKFSTEDLGIESQKDHVYSSHISYAISDTTAIDFLSTQTTETLVGLLVQTFIKAPLGLTNIISRKVAFSWAAIDEYLGQKVLRSWAVSQHASDMAWLSHNQSWASTLLNMKPATIFTVSIFDVASLYETTAKEDLLWILRHLNPDLKHIVDVFIEIGRYNRGSQSRSSGLVLAFSDRQEANAVLAKGIVWKDRFYRAGVRGLYSLIQCDECQSYGHDAAECPWPSRCAKCAGAHLTLGCLASELLCCMCGGAHSARDPSCLRGRDHNVYKPPDINFRSSHGPRAGIWEVDGPEPQRPVAPSPPPISGGWKARSKRLKDPNLVPMAMDLVPNEHGIGQRSVPAASQPVVKRASSAPGNLGQANTSTPASASPNFASPEHQHSTNRKCSF